MSLPALAGASSSASPGPTDWDKLASEIQGMRKELNVHLDEALKRATDWDKLDEALYKQATDWDKLASEFLSKNKVILPALAGASRPASPDSKDWEKLAKEYGVFLAKNMVSEEDLNVHVDEGYEALEALIQGLNSSTALLNKDKLKVSLRQAPSSYPRIAPPPARVPGHRPIATPLPSP